MTTALTRTLGEITTAVMERVGGDSTMYGSAVVVYRTHSDWPQAGIRGTTLYRWLLALRDAGLIAEARTDMEVFGRPDEQSDIAWWLHVTGFAIKEG